MRARTLFSLAWLPLLRLAHIIALKVAIRDAEHGLKHIESQLIDDLAVKRYLQSRVFMLRSKLIELNKT